MFTLTGITDHVRRLSQKLAVSIGQSHHVQVWRTCRHCGTKTRQVARSVSGFYQCLECDQDPNALSEATETHDSVASVTSQ